MVEVRLYWWHLGIAIASAITLYTSSTVAQVTPDATLPNNSNVTLEGNTFNITGGSTAGGNLFHSFKDFSIPTGSSAFFNNPIDIQNIISRVTGKSISNIDGLIKASRGANLFLINPNGIIFGENAKLEIGGSFIGSTANAIQFGNLGTFSATDPSSSLPSLLTINPSALLFSQIQASAIEGNFTPSGNNSSNTSTVNRLRVPDGKSLLLVGGDVNINSGRLTALGGRVELGGLASTGDVALLVDGNNFRLGFPDYHALADVSLTNGAGVDVAGNGGGSIVVNARNLEMDESFFQAGIRQRLGSVNTTAGNVTINATESINMKGGSFIFNLLQPQAVGKGGDINIATGSLSLINGSQIGTSTVGQGDAGSVNINARSTITFDGVSEDGFDASGVINQAFNFTVGRGGDININTGSLSLFNGARLNNSTFGKGDAGNISINARDFVLLDGVGAGGKKNSAIASGVGTKAQGNGGDINITTEAFSLFNGGQIITSTDGKGNAGNVTIQAKDAVSLNGNFERLSSGIFTDVGSTASGKGGDINITAASLSIKNGTQLVTSSVGIGNAGNVHIKARDYILINGVSNYGLSSAIFSSIFSPETIGNGGSIDISTRTLSVTNNAQIVVSAAEGGNAGNVNILANSILLDNNGILNADTRNNRTDVTQATININSRDLILRRNSSITTNARGSLVIGGDININTDVLGAFENSNITANSANFRGGNINIRTQGLFLSLNSAITASGATSALNGNVLISTLVDPSRGLVEIPINLVDASRRIYDACTPGNPGFDNAFVVTGRGGLPISPSEPLQDQSTYSAWVRFKREPESNTVTINKPDLIAKAPTIIEASGWIADKSGNIELVAPASQSLQTSNSVPCFELKPQAPQN